MAPLDFRSSSLVLLPHVLVVLCCEDQPQASLRHHRLVERSGKVTAYVDGPNPSISHVRCHFR